MDSKPKKAKSSKKLISKVVEPGITMSLEEEKLVIKKPSYKKKTTKIIAQEVHTSGSENETIGNIILHLNCSMDDLENKKRQQFKDPLEYNPEIPLDIQTFEQQNTFSSNTYQADTLLTPVSAYQPFCKKCNESLQMVASNPIDVSVSKDIVQQKVRELKISYFLNHIELNKPSACFWCTCEFDSPAFYLPQSETKEKVSVYGSFCCPECAVAYLFQENLDDSMKFERYHLLQKLYRSDQGNIRPAPNPYYLLDKYLGNLTIQEYRQLLQMQQHQYIITVEKPMTRVLPEIHTEGDSVSNISTYKIKRPSEITTTRQG